MSTSALFSAALGRSLRRCRGVVIISAALAACSPSLSESELLQRAATAFERGDYAAAELDLKTAMHKNPDYADARVLYGRLFLRRVLPEAAVDQFERALASEEKPETLVLMARALIANGDSAELVSDYLAGRYAMVADDPEFQAALARAYLAQDEAETAAEFLDAITAVDNDYVDLSRAVYALIVDGDTVAAEALFAAVTDRSPDHAQAWSMRGVVAASMNRMGDAEAFFARASKANPFRITDRLQLANTQIRLGRGEDADAGLSDLAKIIPRSPELNFLRGQLLYDRGEYKEAMDAFSLVLAVNPNHIGAVLLSGNASVLLGNLANAEVMYTELLTLMPGNVEATLRLAEVYRRLGDAPRTEALVRDVLVVDAANERALALLAASLSAQGQYVASARTFDELAVLEPNLPAVRVAAGTQRVAAGDGEAGVQQLREAVELMPTNAPARERLVEALIAVGDLEGASAEARVYVDLMPDSARPYIYLGRLRLQEQRLDDARREFDRALERDAGNLAAHRGLAALAVLEEDLPSAIAYLRAGIAAHPEDVLTHMSLAVLLEQTGDMDGMVTVLEDAMAADVQAAEPRLALARYSLAGNAPGEAVSLLSEIESAGLEDPRIQEVLARAYMAVDYPAAALLRAERLLVLSPEDPAALLLVANVERANGLDDEALAHLETLLAMEPSAHRGRLQLIEMLFSRREYGRVEAEIDRLPDAMQDNASLVQLRGRLALISGDSAAAAEFFSRAFAEEPDTDVLRLLSTAYWASGEQEDAVRLLTNWLDDNPDDTVIVNLALALSDKAIARSPGDASMHLYRARILLRSGRTAEAKDLLTEIINGPESPAHLEARELIATI